MVFIRPVAAQCAFLHLAVQIRGINVFLVHPEGIRKPPWVMLFYSNVKVPNVLQPISRFCNYRDICLCTQKTALILYKAKKAGIWDERYRDLVWFSFLEKGVIYIE